MYPTRTPPKYNANIDSSESTFKHPQCDFANGKRVGLVPGTCLRCSYNTYSRYFLSGFSLTDK
eukprot:13225018-Alexandrium_andersonii.AAC.1